jgi:hypothetical protein
MFLEEVKKENEHRPKILEKGMSSFFPSHFSVNLID